jgi:hypothetical protein
MKSSGVKYSREKELSSSGQKTNKLNLIEFFEKYLNYKGNTFLRLSYNLDAFEIGYGVLLETSGNTKLRDMVPLMKLQTIKDRNNVIVN